jgi:xylulokinase/glycerol kinase
VTPVNRQGQPLEYAILWQDKRALKQAAYIQRTVGDDYIYQKTGLRIDPYFTLPNLLWLREHRPHIFQEAYKFLTVHDLIIHLLTGKFMTDWTQASRTMLFNINELQWDSEICHTFDISPEKLPDAVPPGTIVGGIQPSIAQELELAPDIPVIAVGGDQQAAAIGLGVVSSEVICVNTGTGSFILAHSDTPVFDQKQRVMCSASSIAGKWILDAGIFTTGAVYRWFRDNLARFEKCTEKQSDIDTYDLLNNEAKNSQVGAEGLLFLPHFAGSAAPYWNPHARGLLFGLSLSHKRSSIIRALLEGIALESYKNIQILEALIGDIHEIRVSGGATKSEFFNQIQADVYGKPVILGMSGQSSSLGAAIIAATSIGIYPNVKSAAKHLVKLDDDSRRLPDEETHNVYKKLSTLHDDLYHALNSHKIYEKADEILELMRAQFDFNHNSAHNPKAK